MSADTILALFGIGVSLITALLVFLNARRANQNGEKKLTIEEESADVANEDKIAERRRVELERLYARVDKLEKIVEELQKRDREKQSTIDSQADELERTSRDLDKTNAHLADVRRVLIGFVARVEFAWDNGHDKPSLTDAERALLEHTIVPRAKK